MANKTPHLYIVDVGPEIDTFRAYHQGYANRYTPKPLMEEYISSIVENMVAHFDRQDNGVQSFLQHYAELIVNGVSPNYKYHPLRFIRPNLPMAHYQHYAQLLYGLAEQIYQKFVDQGIFTMQGTLIASFQHLDENRTLYLIERPEAPHVTFS